jgi:hypothetical protein
MFTSPKLKVAVARTAVVLAVVIVSGVASQARPAWFGPGSGPVSPYKNYKGFQQVPRQVGTGQRRGNPAPTSTTAHCVPNVGLVGANGICPD